MIWVSPMLPKFTYWESLTPEPPNLIGAVEPHKLPLRSSTGGEVNYLNVMSPLLTKNGIVGVVKNLTYVDEPIIQHKKAPV